MAMRLLVAVLLVALVAKGTAAPLQNDHFQLNDLGEDDYDRTNPTCGRT